MMMMMVVMMMMMMMVVVKPRIRIALCPFSTKCGLDVHMILSPWFPDIIFIVIMMMS